MGYFGFSKQIRIDAINIHLSGVWLYTFRCLGQIYLLGYTREDGVRLIYLKALGSHEDLYRDLKS